jgi:hypothetical protein
MILPLFRLDAAKIKLSGFVAALLQKGIKQGDFLNIRDADYYEIAKANAVDYLTAKQVATGQSKLAAGAKMAAGFATTMARTAVAIANGNSALCTPEERQARINICAACQFFVASEQRCSECGCKRKKMLDKWGFKQAVCPKNKWPL